MPLRAEVNSETIISAFMSDEEWQALKAQIKQEKLEILMPCCGNTGHMRTSKRGLNHFVHNRRGDCTSASETWQHLKAKFEIAKACRDAGYNTITEAAGDSWRADVLATKGDHIKIAFEVQWSSQTLRETEYRQERYNGDRLRGCWFFRKIPANEYWYDEMPERKDLPMFLLHVDEEKCEVTFQEHIYNLADFVTILLNGKLRFCETLSAKHEQELEFRFYYIPCWQCGAFYYIYTLGDIITSCGREFTLSYTEKGLEYTFDKSIYEKAELLFESRQGFISNIPLAKTVIYQKRDTEHARGSFICPHCNQLLGAYYAHIEFYDKESLKFIVPVHLDKSVCRIRTDSENYWTRFAHWCLSENGDEFCC